MTLAASQPTPTPLLPFLEGRNGGDRDASCHKRQCQGRREISRRHFGIVPVKYKHSTVGLGIFPPYTLPLQPSSPYLPSLTHLLTVWPVSSCRRVYVFIYLSFVKPHLSSFFSLTISLMTHKRERHFCYNFPGSFLFLYA